MKYTCLNKFHCSCKVLDTFHVSRIKKLLISWRESQNFPFRSWIFSRPFLPIWDSYQLQVVNIFEVFSKDHFMYKNFRWRVKEENHYYEIKQKENILLPFLDLQYFKTGLKNNIRFLSCQELPYFSDYGREKWTRHNRISLQTNL